MLPLLLLFHKKSRSAPLLSGKHLRNGSLSLPTFCGFVIKANIYIVKGKHVAVDSAIHNPLGLPSGFSNCFITAPHIAKKPGDAPAIRCLPLFRDSAPLARVIDEMTIHFR